MRIGIDIDGVLNDLGRFHLECGLRFCQQHQLSCGVDPSAYEVRDMFHWTEEDYRRFQKEYYKLFFLTRAYLRPLAAEAVRILRQRSEVYIITGRKPSLMRALDITLPKVSVSDLTLSAPTRKYNFSPTRIRWLFSLDYCTLAGLKPVKS